MFPSTPTSFRLRPETLAQLDRLADLLTARRRLDHADRQDAGDLGIERRVSRAEALSVAIASTLRRLQAEDVREPSGVGPYRAASDAARGLLAGLGRGSAVDALLAERRAEATAEQTASAAPASRRR
jgi:hypothetical protein